MRILIVEDEEKLAAAVAQGLREHNCDAVVACTGEAALEQLRSGSFGLVLLDLMLPGRSGLDILRELRRAGATIPVLILTAKDAIEDRVAGLNSGADDYLVKPFAFSELLARIHAIERRAAPGPPAQLRIADLVLNLRTRIATRQEVPLDLTAREFDLLEYMLSNRGAVISREMLARDVWKETSRFTPLDNVIDVQMARLRRKLDDPFETRLLQTVRGVGFVLKGD